MSHCRSDTEPARVELGLPGQLRHRLVAALLSTTENSTTGIDADTHPVGEPFGLVERR